MKQILNIKQKINTFHTYKQAEVQTCWNVVC